MFLSILFVEIITYQQKIKDLGTCFFLPFDCNCGKLTTLNGFWENDLDGRRHTLQKFQTRNLSQMHLTNTYYDLFTFLQNRIPRTGLGKSTFYFYRRHTKHYHKHERWHLKNDVTL